MSAIRLSSLVSKTLFILRSRLRCPWAWNLLIAFAVLTLAWDAGFAAPETLGQTQSGLSVQAEPASGDYQITCVNPAWTLGGSVHGPLEQMSRTHGQDDVGSFQQLAFDWHDGPTLVTGRIRLYERNTLALFSSELHAARETPPAPFPAFTRLPAGLHVFSHAVREFAPPQFAPVETSTPWLLFDDQAKSLIVSPASHFMVASMLGDGQQRVASGFNPQLRQLPAGFSHQTLVAFGPGINATWELWGRGLLRLQGVQRPGNDSDVILKYLGYWTDNGSSYYYNYDPEKGYAGTLEALVARYRQEGIPLHYLQLDSWWYSKSTTGADGTPGSVKKVQRLPEGEWNRYGGTLDYSAHKALFPEGLAHFQKAVGLPLITHARWIDPASPYQQRYQISGLAPVDPKWWDDTAAYLKASGVITYEQDWLDRIYSYSPAFSSNLFTGEAFLDNMARACAKNGITLQYCMPYACYYLQGSRYTNLTSVRTSTDRLGPNRWNDFLYTSRLASALGLWPWTDVYNSTERNNVLLSTLSAGPVGIGDAIGNETKTNLLRAVRADGVIVKPDVPIVPTDSSYLADARKLKLPLLASTFTEQSGLKTVYVFACARPKTPGGEVRFAPADFGLSGPVYLYNYFSAHGRRLDASSSFTANVAANRALYYILAPVGKSGIAFLGDSGKFVSTGRQRIAGLQDELGQLTAKIVFAETEGAVTLHGYAPAAPKVTAQGGQVSAVRYEADSQHFEMDVSPDPAAPLDRTTGDPVRQVTVVLKSQVKLHAAR